MKFIYEWKDNIDITMFLICLYSNTRANLEAHYIDIKYANEILNDTEEYLHYLIEHDYNLDIILPKLKKLLYVTFEETNYIKNGNITYLNKKLTTKNNEVLSLVKEPYSNNLLNSRERRRLSLYYGLSKYLFTFVNDKTIEFSKLYSDLFEGKEEVESLVNNGWLLLEDTLSQELAERITYYSLNKKRPGLRPGIEEHDNYPIAGSKVSSRLEQYRPFEELTINFGTTISGVGSILKCSEEDFMNDLLIKGMDKDFSNRVISEYIYNDNELELYTILYFMGLLINEKYATYGTPIVKNISLDIEEVNNIYDNLKNILNSLFNLNDDEFIDIPIKEVNKNIFVKKRINKLINNGLD